jgi:hypothetical protein
VFEHYLYGRTGYEARPRPLSIANLDDETVYKLTFGNALRSSGLVPRYGHVTAPLLILKLSYAILISLENGATFAKTLRFAA